MADEQPEQPGQAAGTNSQSILTTGGILLAIAALYFGSELFIPFALAVLLAFAISPIIDALRRWRVPRVPAVIFTVALAMLLIASVSYVLSTQLIRLAESIPSYQHTMLNKIDSMRGEQADGSGVIDRLAATLERLRSRLAQQDEREPSGLPRSASDGQDRADPIPVIIESEASSPMDVFRSVIGPLLKPLTTAGLAIVFVLFVLLERDDLRDRFIKLVGAGDLQTSTEALNEAGHRISRYLLMQLILNVSYGVPFGIGLYIIGVPNAVLWGLLAIFLRFIPYLGPFLAALFPMTLAFAVDPGWSMLLWVAGLFLAMELVSNNFLEPWLYGSSTGLSPLSVIAAAIFWTTLWGPVGLILSTPLTVCLIVIGRYVPRLSFLGTLLGSDPVLAPEEQLYQRLLSQNHEGAIEIAERYVDEHSAPAFYDHVAIPALRLAENDRQRDAGAGGFRRTVAEGMSAVVPEVTEYAQQRKRGDEEAGDDAASHSLGEPCLCIGGKTDLDRVAAEMVAQTLREHGIGSRVLPPITVSQNGIGRIDLAGVDVVCLSYLAQEPQTYASFVCRRLKRRAPNLKIVVCLWNTAIGPTLASELKDRSGADAVVSSIAAAVTQIAALTAPPVTAPMQAAPIPENEQDRLRVLQTLGLVKAESRHFDEVAAKVAAAFGTPIALVSVVDEAHQNWPGATGLPPALDACRREARETSICGHVVAMGEMVVVEDVSRDKRFANNPFLIENEIRFYAGAPLRTRSGFTLGSLCVIDTKPRSFGSKEQALLRRIADDLMHKVEQECEGVEETSSGSSLAARTATSVVSDAEVELGRAAS
ncbi:AI-2E family transporter [Dongia deserti]|uniref:AI-2E family transporter n=1 Tax=Dongia deserti TaxID=2268030 RepID=UPI000E64D57D|nr:AI-2E family transporter [Dongia deserti]